MHRIIILKVGGKRLHLLKVTGSLVVVGAALGVLSAIASMFRLLKQLELAQLNPQLAAQAFGLTPSAITSDIALGLFMAPSAWLMFWIALFVIGAMVYRSGNVLLPIEEEVEKEGA